MIIDLRQALVSYQDYHVLRASRRYGWRLVALCDGEESQGEPTSLRLL